MGCPLSGPWTGQIIVAMDPGSPPTTLRSSAPAGTPAFWGACPSPGGARRHARTGVSNCFPTPTLRFPGRSQGLQGAGAEPGSIADDVVPARRQGYERSMDGANHGRDGSRLSADDPPVIGSGRDTGVSSYFVHPHPRFPGRRQGLQGAGAEPGSIADDVVPARRQGYERSMDGANHSRDRSRLSADDPLVAGSGRDTGVLGCLPIPWRCAETRAYRRPELLSHSHPPVPRPEPGPAGRWRRAGVHRG